MLFLRIETFPRADLISTSNDRSAVIAKLDAPRRLRKLSTQFSYLPVIH